MEPKLWDVHLLFITFASSFHQEGVYTTDFQLHP